MREYVFTEVGLTGWHIDGSFQPAPFAYSLYHMVSLPLKGDTVFAPLNEIVDNLPSEKRNEWERLWMMSDRQTGPILPLIYPHTIAQKKVNLKNWFFVLFCVFSEFLNNCSCF
jgi:alpha-ketoglutarate-dependent taurine dioxygenase